MLFIEYIVYARICQKKQGGIVFFFIRDVQSEGKEEKEKKNPSTQRLLYPCHP